MKLRSRSQHGKCQICGKQNSTVPEVLPLCSECCRLTPEDAVEIALGVHAETRAPYPFLSQSIPRTSDGKRCNNCSNECVLENGERGFCGVRGRMEDGKLRHALGKDQAYIHTYLDPMPTNCCAAWFCPGCTGSGYPKYAVSRGTEYGHFNLASFFYGCNFSCLGCQNSSHKRIKEAPTLSGDQFVKKTRNPKITCVCWFGGSPEPHLPWALKTGRRVLEDSRDNGKVMRICYEWNGGGGPLAKRAVEQSLISGGIVKFDLKTFSPHLSEILSGVSNKRTYENFKTCYDKFYEERPEVPVLTATTLLVPSFVDTLEVEEIAKFLAELNPDIPYSLLIFHGDWMFRDLGFTPEKQVIDCYRTAKNYLHHVNVGNLHLLPSLKF